MPEISLGHLSGMIRRSKILLSNHLLHPSTDKDTCLTPFTLDSIPLRLIQDVGRNRGFPHRENIFRFIAFREVIFSDSY